MDARSRFAQRNISVQKTEAVYEKELQLKFLKESFPGVNPMTLHDALCEVHFNADEAAQILLGISKNVSDVLSFAEWKNDFHSKITSGDKSEEKPSSNSAITKRSSTSTTINDTKRAKLEKLFKEKKSTKLTSDEVKKTLVQRKQMTLNFIPKEKTNSLETKVGRVEEGSGSDSKLPRNESLEKSQKSSKHLRSSGPISFKILEFINNKKSKKSSEKKESVDAPRIEETSSDSTHSVSVLNSPESSYFNNKSETTCSDFNFYDGNDLESDRNVLLNIFQTASVNDLNFITSFSKKAVDAIIECRPYKNWIDLVQKMQDNKFLDVDVLNTSCQLLDIYKKLKSLVSKLDGISKTIKKEITLQTITKQPSLISPNVRLMEHQMLGLNWFVSLCQQKINGILVDEDQFSTSVQVISFLAYLKEVNATKTGIPHLVVIPSWKKDDWQSDFRRICPELKVFLYHGTKEDRRRYRNDWYKGDLAKYDVILAIQGTFLSTPEEVKMFRIIQFHCVVFDDAAALKSITNIYHEHVLKIKASQKLLLLNKSPEVNILEMVSLLKYTFPTDFNISSEDLMTFINNKYLTLKKSTSFHLGIIEDASKILKNVMFQRLKQETPVASVPTSSSSKSDLYINDQIESVIKEIQRLDLPIKLAFSQLTTPPHVVLQKLNLVDEITRINEEDAWKGESRVAVRGGRGGWRGRGGFGMRSRARGRGPYSSHSRYHNEIDSSSAEWTRYSSNESSTESSSTSIDSNNLTDEISYLYEDDTKKASNVAMRGRKWSGDSDSCRQLKANVAKRGRKFGETVQISRIHVEGDKNDRETTITRSTRGKRSRRGRRKRQEVDTHVPKLTSNSITVQTTSTSTKKILEVKPTIVQTTRLEDANSKEVESDDTFSDPNFEESNSSTSSDTDESWDKHKVGKKKILRNSKKNQRKTRSNAEKMSKSAGDLLKTMLNDIWNKEMNNKSQKTCEENVTNFIVDEVKVEYEDITIKEEPLLTEFKVEEGTRLQPFIESSQNEERIPSSPQEDPLFLHEEELKKLTEQETQSNAMLNIDYIANNQETTAPSRLDNLTEQVNKEPEKSSICIDLTNDNDYIVLSDDSEVEEQLNEKISFNEVLADIDEQRTMGNNKNKRIKEEPDNVDPSDDPEIIDINKDVQPRGEANTCDMPKIVSSELEHSEKSDKSDNGEEFSLEITSDTDSGDEYFRKKTNVSLKRDDIMTIILGDVISKSLKTNNLKDVQVRSPETIKDKSVSENPDPVEQGTSKEPYSLKNPKSKLLSFRTQKAIEGKLFSTKKDDKLLDSLKKPHSDIDNENIKEKCFLKDLESMENNNIEIVLLYDEKDLSKMDTGPSTSRITKPLLGITNTDEGEHSGGIASAKEIHLEKQSPKSSDSVTQNTKTNVK